MAFKHRIWRMLNMIYRYENQAFDLDMVTSMDIDDSHLSTIRIEMVNNHQMFLRVGESYQNVGREYSDEIREITLAAAKPIFDDIFKHWQATKRPTIKVEGD